MAEKGDVVDEVAVQFVERARPFVVAVMFACVMESVALLIQAFLPGWNATYAVVAIFLISLEAYYATRTAQRLRLSGRDRWIFRLSEWTVILLALKLGPYATRGLDALAADFATWEADLATLFTLEFVIVLVLAAFTWMGSGDVARWLDDLTQPTEAGFNPYLSLSAIQSLFFVGGVLLVIAAGLTQVGLQAVLHQDRPPVGGVIVNVLVYFVSGLLLLSQARMEVLHTQWRVSQVNIGAGIRSRWIGLGLATLVVVAALALLLPTRYTVGVLDVAAGVLRALGNIGLIIGYGLNFVLFLILGLFTMLLSLLLGRSTGEAAPPPAPPVLPPAAPPNVTPDWLSLLRSLLFWLVTTGILGYALAQFIGARREWWLSLAHHRSLGWLVRLLLSLWGQSKAVAVRAGAAVRQRLAQARRAIPTPPRAWLRLNSLSPRELVMYFYLSTARRAEESGLPRGRSQTAREYSQRLQSTLPEGEADVTTLTEAFEAARYSAHAVEREDTARPRRSWERLRKLLRGRKPEERE